MRSRRAFFWRSSTAILELFGSALRLAFLLGFLGGGFAGFVVFGAGDDFVVYAGDDFFDGHASWCLRELFRPLWSCGTWQRQEAF